MNAKVGCVIAHRQPFINQPAKDVVGFCFFYLRKIKEFEQETRIIMT